MNGQSARTNRYRQRKRAGIAVLSVATPHFDFVEALLAAERLTVADALDRRRVEHAASEILAEWAHRWNEKM